MAAADAGLLRTFFTLALGTGLRIGELLALAWSHVNLDARTLRVSRSASWVRGPGSGYRSWQAVIGPPKSDSSYRTLDLAPQLVAILREWKMRSAFKADEDLVFPNLSGKPLNRSVLSVALRETRERCPGMPRVTPHGLRHTFASLMILDNRPVTQVAKLLGHSDPSVTMKRYSHWFRQLEERNRDAMTVLADHLFGSTPVADAAASGAST